MLYQPPLRETYDTLTAKELTERIQACKSLLGNKLVILGHHYQQDDVIDLADFRGDSFKLSQIAASQRKAEYVIFCGVHFMAESADILTEDRVKVILPDLSAGCSMADMATLDQVQDAWHDLSTATDAKIVPITYVNSSADIKAFCGGHDGACCTSSNARTVLEWALDGESPDRPTGRRKVIFLPDQHLGRNTAYSMGWPLDSMALYDPSLPSGGLTPDQIRQATFFLWNGHCSVHQLFTAQQVDDAHANDPDCKVIVHPECDWAVVQKADMAGSTGFILNAIETAPEGSRWAVGTEVNLVQRLANQYKGTKQIRLLAGIQCLCTTMYRIDPRHLLWVLDELVEGRVVNQITVEPETKANAKIALDRMLSLTGDGAAKT